MRDDLVPVDALNTPHLNPLPFTKGRGGRSAVNPKLTINERYPAWLSRQPPGGLDGIDFGDLTARTSHQPLKCWSDF